MNPGLPVRADLAGVEPYGAPVLDVPNRLNVNENPYSPSADVVAQMGRAAADALASANRYPDRECIELRAELASLIGGRTAAANIWPANGSNEVMHQIFAAFGGPGRRALSFAPTYSLYPQYARETFTEYVTAPRRGDFELDMSEVARSFTEARPSLVVVASPNNPTGTLLPAGQLDELLDLVAGADAMLIVDEAYVEFADVGVFSATARVPDSDRLIVTRTMSKAFGLAGLRLGYAVASAEAIDAVRIVRLPYHLSSTTQAMACVAARNAPVLLAPVATLRAERRQQAEWFSAVGLDVAASQANFLLVGCFADREATWRALVDQGVLVRMVGPDGWLRVSVGTPEENQAMRQAMSIVLDSGAARLLGSGALRDEGLQS
ncbi:MAG: histidinol-phosphate transaminase [Candidatus Nanopelagicales bacterium]|nr:histidinol-phosphate transaminase [Candidatus Nanopelagicales bacterium]MDZ4250794.1 histidinol-phosphate transaminase [Candidatus Nanopelagicales bacterium]